MIGEPPGGGGPGGGGWGPGGRGGDQGPERMELVTLEGVKKAKSGKISFGFRNLSFCVTDLVIEGKYDRAWAASQIDKLRKEGKLKVKPPEKPGGKTPPAPDTDTEL